MEPEEGREGKPVARKASFKGLGWSWAARRRVWETCVPRQGGRESDTTAPLLQYNCDINLALLRVLCGAKPQIIASAIRSCAGSDAPRRKVNQSWVTHAQKVAEQIIGITHCASHVFAGCLRCKQGNKDSETWQPVAATGRLVRTAKPRGARVRHACKAL